MPYKSCARGNCVERNGQVTNVYYWRERGAEADFVLERKGKVTGVEVKSSAAIPTTGMGAFREQFRPDKVLLAGGSGLPWQDFLKMNPVELF